MNFVLDKTRKKKTLKRPDRSLTIHKTSHDNKYHIMYDSKELEYWMSTPAGDGGFVLYPMKMEN